MKDLLPKIFLIS